MKLRGREQAGMYVTFIGTTPNIGTTVVSFGTAWNLAKHTSLSVGYICLNLKSSKIGSYLSLSDQVLALDHLRPYLKSHQLSPERLRWSSHSLKGLPNLYVLPGNSRREHAEFYTMEEVKHVLDAARSAFDVVIVEVNAYWDNAATLQAAMESEMAVIVTTPNVSHCADDYNGWFGAYKNLSGASRDECAVFVNHCDSRKVDPRHIAEGMGLRLGGWMGRHAYLDSYVAEGRLLRLFEEKAEAAASLERLAAVVAAKFDIHEWDRPMKPRSWIHRLVPITT